MIITVLDNPRRCDVNKPEQCRQLAHVGITGQHGERPFAMCERHVRATKNAYQMSEEVRIECMACGGLQICPDCMGKMGGCAFCAYSGACHKCGGLGYYLSSHQEPSSTITYKLRTEHTCTIGDCEEAAIMVVIGAYDDDSASIIMLCEEHEKLFFRVGREGQL